MDNTGNGPRNPDDHDKPIPLESDVGASTPAKEGPAGGPAPVSRAPLNLGGSGTSTAPHPASPAAPGAASSPAPHPAGPAPHPAPPAAPGAAPSPAPHPAGPALRPPSSPAPHPAAGPASGPAPSAGVPATPKIQVPQLAIRKPVAAVAPAPAGRITACKTFFTKLHPGAIEFMDEQISTWLKENPGIVIRHTNVVTGEIQGKKTEPNILVLVWY